MLVARRQLGLDRPSFSGGGGGGEAAGEEAAAGEDLEGVPESTEPLVRPWLSKSVVLRLHIVVIDCGCPRLVRCMGLRLLAAVQRCCRAARIAAKEGLCWLTCPDPDAHLHQ